MTKQEVELIKHFWFAYHKESMTCGLTDSERDATHHSICLEVAEWLNKAGVCYRELLLNQQCGCKACKGLPAASFADVGRPNRNLFTKLGKTWRPV